MALISNIVISLEDGTAVLAVTRSGDVVETISYENIGQTVTFASRDDITITSSEFIDLCNQVNILQTAILFNYLVNQLATTPFSVVSCIERNAITTWDFTFSLVDIPDPNVADYSDVIADSQVFLAGRHGNKILQFPEWIYFLQSLTHYRKSVITSLAS